MTLPIRSQKSSPRGCLCGAPFPLRVYFLRAGEELPVRPGDTFLITCRQCGSTYPLAVEGLGAPPFGGEKT